MLCIRILKFKFKIIKFQHVNNMTCIINIIYNKIFHSYKMIPINILCLFLQLTINLLNINYKKKNVKYAS